VNPKLDGFFWSDGFGVHKVISFGVVSQICTFFVPDSSISIPSIPSGS
jgi:hypothetical protein